jgi:hypothetical protein
MAIWWWVKRLALLLIALFILRVGLRAIEASWDNAGFPEALAVKLELLPWIFPIHMVTGGLALLLVPVTIGLRGTAFHKWAGRIAAVDVVVAGVTAVPVALAQPVSTVAAAGFATQGVLWVLLLAKGIWHIRRQEYVEHQRVMLMMAAVTFGAVFFRLYLATFAAFGSRHYFKLFYGLDSWVAWLLPLAAVSVWLRNDARRTRKTPAMPKRPRPLGSAQDEPR